jgi:hypothetical protein
VQLDGQCVLAELGPVRGVGAGAVRRQTVGLRAALHAGGAIGVEGHGVGQHQREGFVQALRERLDVEFRAQLFAHLGDGVLPGLAGRVVVRQERRRGGGLVAEELVTRVVSGSRVAGVYARLVIVISPLWRVVDGRAAVLLRGLRCTSLLCAFSR